MPTERFKNLSKEKQERIIDAALHEFAKGLDDANVAGIVERANISRGSFYQYFKSIEELLEYIFNLIIDTKRTYLADVIAQAGEIPFLDFFRASFLGGLRFAEAYPEFVAIGTHLYASTDPKLIQFVKRAEKMAVDAFIDLIQRDKSKGLIRSSVDSEILATLLMSMLSDIGVKQLYSGKAGEGEMIDVVDSLIDIVRSGIVSKGGRGDV